MPASPSTSGPPPANPGIDTGTTLMLAIITWNRLDYLKQCVESWLATRDPDYNWIVAIADDGSTDGTLEYLNGLDLPNETHILHNYHRYAAGQTNTLFQLSTTLTYDLGFKIDDDVIFSKPGWDKLYLNAVRRSGYDHLCHFNLPYREIQQPNNPNILPAPVFDPSGTCVSHADAASRQGRIFTFTPKLLENVGYNDELNFPIRGQWHLDYSARACRAGHNKADTFFDACGSSDFITYQECQPGYRCSLPWGDEYKKTKTSRELKRRSAILSDDQRVFLPLRTYRVLPPKQHRFTLNGEFEKVFVLNLDRRLDRWANISAQAATFGVNIQRWSATDGQTEHINQDWQRYQSQELAQFSTNTSPITQAAEFFLDHDRDIPARIAYQEQELQAKAVQTPGAWGYLHSMRRLLRHAIDAKLENILVLDDDVLFHHEFLDRFSHAINQLPTNWTLIQLGALQYHWEPDWIRWHSKNAYHCNGSSIGSHAVAIHNRAFATILEECERFRMPYDLGALHLAKHRFHDTSFTFFPNLMIQDVSESDIGSSLVQEAEGQRKNNIYRWDLSDYYQPKKLACAS